MARDDNKSGSGCAQSSRVQDALELMKDFGWCTIENTAAVVNSGFDKGMDQSFGGREEEQQLEISFVFYLEKDTWLIKREVAVRRGPVLKENLNNVN